MQVITGGFAQGKLEYVMDMLSGRQIIVIDESNYQQYETILENKKTDANPGKDLFDHSGADNKEDANQNVDGQAGLCVVINHLNRIIKNVSDRDEALAFVRKVQDFCSCEKAELIIISDELGCGIIPIDPEDRQNREDNGRIMCILAAEADSVIRIVCGIPQKIK